MMTTTVKGIIQSLKMHVQTSAFIAIDYNPNGSATPISQFGGTPAF